MHTAKTKVPLNLIFSDKSDYRDQYFPVFSLYIILSYGFEYFSSPDFSLTYVNSSQTSLRVGERTSLVCRADNYWEWCR